MKNSNTQGKYQWKEKLGKKFVVALSIGTKRICKLFG